jgi:hypothetical protein
MGMRRMAAVMAKFPVFPLSKRDIWLRNFLIGFTARRKILGTGFHFLFAAAGA